MLLQNLSLSAQITLLGMSLVFGSILVLWLAMAVLMKLTTWQKKPKKIEAEATPASSSSTRLSELRKRAAIAAITAALPQETQTGTHELPIPQTAQVSPWQTVNRSEMMRKRGRVR